MLDIFARVRHSGARIEPTTLCGALAGTRPALAGDWGELYVVPDASYRLSRFAEGLVVHDGRVLGWETDPARWIGSFAAFTVRARDDGSGKGLTAISDLLGTIPLYRVNTPRETFLSSKLAHLTRLGFTTLDSLGAWELVLFDQPLWSVTLLQGVELLPPATVCALQCAGPTEVRRYWQLPLAADAVRRNEAQLVDELIGHLEAAHGRALVDVPQLAFPVTGGLDSRMNLALDLAGHAQDVLLFHCENAGTLEASIVKSIAGQLGLPLRTLAESACLLALPRLDPEQESGELNAAQYWLDPAIADLAAFVPQATLLDGYLQDFLFNPLLVSSDPNPSSADKAMRRARYRHALLETGDCPQLLGRIEEHFRDGYGGESGALDASQRNYLENRSRRFVLGCARLAQNHLRVVMPACDRELIEFALSLPYEQRHGARAYRQAIDRLAPALAAVAYDKTGLPITSTRKCSWRMSVSRRGQAVLDQAWPTRPILRGAEADIDVLLRENGELRSAITSGLAGSEWVCSITQGRQALESLCNRQQGGKNLGTLLLSLWTLAKLDATAHAAQ